MYEILLIHFESALGKGGHTSFQQSYDDDKKLFRFDLQTSGIY